MPEEPEKIEELLENYALVRLMADNHDEPALEFQEAQEYYRKLEKALSNYKNKR